MFHQKLQDWTTLLQHKLFKIKKHTNIMTINCTNLFKHLKLIMNSSKKRGHPRPVVGLAGLVAALARWPNTCPRGLNLKAATDGHTIQNQYSP